MAGLCSGLGLTTDPVSGLLTLDGARQVSWPYSCLPADANGLRVDPVAGTAWVPPDFQTYFDVSVGPNKNLVPGGVGTTLLQTLTTTQKVPDCGRARWVYWILGGHAGWRTASGNFWTVERDVVVEVDGVVVGYTGGYEQVSVSENHSGGVIASGSAVDAVMANGILEPGQTIKITANYNLRVYTYAANAVNSLAWRSPRLTATLWRPHP